jgi:vitamin B12 transporter
MGSFFIAAMVLSLLPKLCLAAQPAGQTLPSVVVTATRTEIPTEQLTTSLTVVTAEEIKRQHAETVLQALRTVRALDVVQSGSRGTAASVFIRGADSDQVLVLIDGVEVNSTTTESSISLISPRKTSSGSRFCADRAGHYTARKRSEE